MAIIFGLHLPIIIASHLFSDEVYQVSWHTPKYLTTETLLLSLACVLAISFGFAGGTIKLRRKSRWRGPNVASRPRLKSMLNLGLTLTALGAILWFIFALQQGLSLHAVASFFAQERGASTRLKKEYFATLPGVTTMTQFGMAAAIIAGVLRELGRCNLTRWAIFSLLTLNAARALIVSERLAFIEIAVPLVVLIVHFNIGIPLPRRTRILITTAPVVGVFSVFIMFIGFEAFRSWTYYSAKSDSLLTFSSARLVGYYATAMNNSALLLDRLPQNDIPNFTQQWLWRMPGIKTMAEHYNPAGEQYVALLESAANPEYNNPGGFLLPLKDFGTPGGLMYWVIFGFIVSKSYQSFRTNRLPGLLFYPLIYVGLLELSRLLYLSDSRAFPSLLLLSLATLYCKKTRKPRRSQLHDSQVTVESHAHYYP